MKFNGLEQYFETVNSEIVDFTKTDYSGKSPLMYALKHNQSKNLNLSSEQFDYLIKNSCLKQTNSMKWSALMYALRYNKEESLNLSSEQFDYLIKNSDLKQTNHIGWSPLMYALIFKKDKNLNLSKEQWKYLIENSDLSLISDKEELIDLKKIQSELINDEIFNKIEIKEEHCKIKKI